MNIEQLRCFIILSETLSFSHTAEIVNLTQPAVTHQIKKLENALKFQLFNRTKQSISLTDEGSAFYVEIKDVVDRLQIAIDKTRMMKDKVFNVIKIGYEGHNVEMNKLPVIINQFKKFYPHSRFLVFKSNHKERRTALLNHKYDLILTTRDDIENDDGVIYKEIISAGLTCMMSKTHKLSAEAIITPEHIKNENIILFDPVRGPRGINLIQSDLIRCLPDACFTYSDSEISAMILIQSHEGVAIMPSFCQSGIKGVLQIPYESEGKLSYGVAYMKDRSDEKIKKLSRLLQNGFFM